VRGNFPDRTRRKVKPEKGKNSSARGRLRPRTSWGKEAEKILGKKRLKSLNNRKA